MADAILTGVTLDRDIWGDARFDYLAQLCGLADGDHARVKMARLWAMCTARKTPSPTKAWVVVCLGPKGMEALLEADLGEQMPDGSLRLKGCERFDWYVQRPHVAGGKARAAGAKTDARGRFVSSDRPARSSDRPATEPADVQRHQQAPAQDLDQGSEQEDQGERSLPGDHDPPRAGARPALPGLPVGWMPDQTDPSVQVATAQLARSGLDLGRTVAKFIAHARNLRFLPPDLNAAWSLFALNEHMPTEREREANRARKAEEERSSRRRGPISIVRDVPESERVGPGAAAAAIEEAMRIASGSNPT